MSDEDLGRYIRRERRKEMRQLIGITVLASTIVGYFGLKAGQGITDLLSKPSRLRITNEDIDSKLNVLRNREINRRNLEEASRTLPAEESTEDQGLESLRSQYQELREHHKTMGESLNRLEQSLYPK